MKTRRVRTQLQDKLRKKWKPTIIEVWASGNKENLESEFRKAKKRRKEDLKKD